MKFKLGKYIKEFGDYDIITETINEQVKEAIYKAGNAVILKDTILLKDSKLLRCKRWASYKN